MGGSWSRRGRWQGKGLVSRPRLDKRREWFWQVEFKRIYIRICDIDFVETYPTRRPLMMFSLPLRIS